MMVIEYEGSIVVVDVGLRFPTAEMLGIDLVLPDFSYLRDRVEDIEAIVITHGHEDHLGALPWVLRDLRKYGELPPVYGSRLTIAMARSKLDEHKLRDVELVEVLPGDEIAAGAFDVELIHMTHSIPDTCAVALTCDVGTVLMTGDYKFDQTPVDGEPADVQRLAELGREGVLLLCGDSTNADRAGFSPSERVVGPHLEEVFARAEGRIIVTSFASNIHRVQQVIDAACGAGPQGRAGRPLDAQERRYRPLARAHRGARGHPDPAAGGRGLARPPGGRDLDRVAGRAALGAAADGAQRPPPDQAARRGHGRLLGHADPRQRARRQRDDRPALPHRLRRGHDRRRSDPRLRPRLRRGDQADAEPRAAALRAAGARRPQADPSARQLAEAVGIDADNIFRGNNGLPLEIDEHGAALRRAGAVGHDLRRRGRHRRSLRRGAARPPDALGRRHLHRGGDDLRVGRAARWPTPR